MFDWSRLIEDIGVKTIFAIFYRSKEKLLDMTDGIEEHFHPVKISKFVLLRDARILISLISLYIQHRRKDKIIYQTRDPQVVFPLIVVKLLPKTRIIYESRAAGEYENTLQSNGILNNIKLSIRTYREKKMIKVSHKTICVSNAMINYYMAKHNLYRVSKYCLVYGAANEKIFYYSEKLRYETRKRLKLGDQLVVIYSGALNKYWQVPEKLFKFFGTLGRDIKSVSFLVLTKDIEIAKELFEKNKISPSSCMVKWVPLQELNDYYNAADFGILLREDLILNKVSSPTKIAEYLLSGLPIIISRAIEDYAEYIKTQKYGIVLENLQSAIETPLPRATKLLLNSSNYNRNDISTLAKEKFSKQSYLKLYHELYETV